MFAIVGGFCCTVCGSFWTYVLGGLFVVILRGFVYFGLLLCCFLVCVLVFVLKLFVLFVGFGIGFTEGLV